MSFQSGSATNTHKAIQQEPDNAISLKPLTLTVIEGSSFEELTMTAMLDPCLTFEEARLQARIQQCHL